jgi:acyl-coenzyme A thioesterase PaaI-like protein
MTRTRTYDWDDPSLPVRAAAGMNGLDLLRLMRKGELPPPPIMQTLGIRLVEVDFGRAVFAAQAAEYMYNPIGSVHATVES